MLYVTTRKKLNDSQYPVISIKKPDHDILLAGLYPEAYTQGTLGVNCYVYQAEGAILCAGYRAFPGIVLPNADELVAYLHEYEKGHTAYELYEEIKTVRSSAIQKLLETYPKSGSK